MALREAISPSGTRVLTGWELILHAILSHQLFNEATDEEEQIQVALRGQADELEATLPGDCAAPRNGSSVGLLCEN